MTPLRKQMIQDMTLAGLSETTQKLYIGIIRTFLRHVQTPPEKVTEQQLTAYLLLRQKMAKGTFITNRAALCLLFRDTLRRPWPLFQKKCVSQARYAFRMLSRMSGSTL